MPNYSEILAFLADNPPELDSERELHASVLELLAGCLRTDHMASDDEFADSKGIRGFDVH